MQSNSFNFGDLFSLKLIFWKLIRLSPAFVPFLLIECYGIDVPEFA